MSFTQLTGRSAAGARARTLARLGALTFTALTIPGCGDTTVDGTGHDGRTATVDTLPDGRVHVRNAKDGRWGLQDRWAGEVDLRIGSRAGGEADEFGRVVDIAVDRQGVLYVLEAFSREIRVFDADGRRLGRFGRRGGGPGEIGLGSGLDWGADGGLWVADSENGRFQVFDAGGAPRESHPYAPGMFQWGDVWGADGLLYTHVADRGRAFRLRIVRRRLEGEALVPVDTLLVPMTWDGEIVPVTIERDGRVVSLMLPIPFQATSKRLLVPAAGWWLSHEGDAYRLAFMDFRGDTLLVTERPYDPVPVTDADIDGVLEDLGGAARGIDRTRIPSVHPPVEDMALLPDGHLLVHRRLDAERSGYDVFDPGGVFLGPLSWEGADRFTLHAASNEALYGVEEDESGVPHVVRVSLRR